MSACVNERVYTDSLKSKVALFNQVAEKHVKGQAINPFSNGYKSGSLPRPSISKEEYGRPPKGSLSELRATKATVQINREVLQLCDVINECGERLFPIEEKPNDPRIAISFGELFSIYTAISNKVVGILLRARKLNFVEFEGECLFQRKDDHVPIIMLKPIEQIRQILRDNINKALKYLEENGEDIY